MSSDNTIIPLDDARSEPDPEAVAELEALFAASRQEPEPDFFGNMTDAIMAQVTALQGEEADEHTDDPADEVHPPGVIDLARERERRRPSPAILISAIAAALLLGFVAWWIWPSAENGVAPIPGDNTPSVAQDDTTNPPEDIGVANATPNDEGELDESTTLEDDWRELEADDLEALDETLRAESLGIDTPDTLDELSATEESTTPALATLDEMELAELEALALVLDNEFDTL